MDGLPSPMLVGSPDHMHSYLVDQAKGVIVEEDRRGEEQEK
jgi:hypothetical protein